jgi:hypothetical protein
MRPLFATLLLTCCSFSSAHQYISGQIAAQSGSSVTLTLHLLPLPGHLINKQVPTKISLETPFGAPIVTTLEGAYTKSFDPEFSEYYGTVKPLEFQLEVPANTQPGRYALKLTGQVRFCSKTQHLCVSDMLEGAYQLEVGNKKSPNLHAFALIGLTDEDALEGQ